MATQVHDVVVIGGGCVGASVAFHLAEAGCTDVVLLEAGALGGGSTGKAAGGIRTQHEDPLNVRLVQRSLREFTRFAELTGTEIDFKQVGYLFLLDNAADVALFESANAMQRELGVQVERLTPVDVATLLPQVTVDDLLMATLSPADGYATPDAVVQGYATAARRHGVTVRPNVGPVRVDVRDGAIVGAHTATDTYLAPVVVCAAGVGSQAVAADVGVRLPVEGLSRRIFFSRESAGLADAIPLTIDFSTSFYFHREGPGLVFAGPQSAPEDLMGPATHRLPGIADVPITTSWAGDYDLSPDHNGMVGHADEAKGFYYATGFSGHGFMLSPAVGEHFAELITGRQPTIDLAELSAARFATEHGARAERIVI